MSTTDELRGLAEQYTAAWCSQDAASVASFYSPRGSLRINQGPPAIGRAAITAAVQEFMTAFPDLKVFMDGVSVKEGRTVYRWTFVGTHTGPGGTGNRVQISGFEDWRIGADGLIAESSGHFDATEYQRQLSQGVNDSG